MSAVEGIGIEVEDSLSGGGGSGGDDGLREAGVDNNKVEIGGFDKRIQHSFVHK